MAESASDPAPAAPTVPDSPVGASRTTAPPDRPEPADRTRRRRLLNSTPVLLLQAAHLRLALLVAALVGAAGWATYRDGREILLLVGTTLVGQVILGWHRSLADRRRDQARGTPHKPIADGRLDPGTVWFALWCAILVLVPIAMANGVIAGSYFLCFVAIGLLGNVMLRANWFSWVPWAAAYGVLPAFVQFADWIPGLHTEADQPTVHPAYVILSGLVGIAVHFLIESWNADLEAPADAPSEPTEPAEPKRRSGPLPIRMAARLGPARTAALSALVMIAALVAMLVIDGG